MARPIPRRLLTDTMVVRVPDGQGGHREGVTVARVRLDRTQRVSGDAHRGADAGSGKVYVDAVNSIGGFGVPAGSRVVVGGHSYLVRECRECRGFNGGVHHWELVVS